MLADSTTTALLAPIAHTIVLADLRPTLHSCTESVHDRARRLSPTRTLALRAPLPCGQALHTLQFDRYFTPCSHGPFVGGALFRFVPFVVTSAPTFSVSSTSSYSSRATLTSGHQNDVLNAMRSARPESGRKRRRLAAEIFCQILRDILPSRSPDRNFRPGLARLRRA